MTEPFFTERRYEQTLLWRNNGNLRPCIENAMQALAMLIPDGWVGPMHGQGRLPRHSLRLALLHSDPVSFWTAFRVGEALHRLGGHVSDWHRGRLLDPGEFDGAAHEAEVGGMLAASSPLTAADMFDWHPQGGDLRVRGGARHFVEAKARQSMTARAEAALMWQFRLRDELSALLDGRAVAFALEPTANAAERRERHYRKALHADPGIVARPLADAAREQLRNCDRCVVAVPNVGRLWVAPTEAELEVRGFQGYALDESYEADQVVRSCVNAALRQLPQGARALVVVRYNGLASPSIVLAQVFRRLQRIREDQCRVDGVLILQGWMSLPLDTGLPRQVSWFVPGPHPLDDDTFGVLAPLLSEYPLMPPPGHAVASEADTSDTSPSP